MKRINGIITAAAILMTCTMINTTGTFSSDAETQEESQYSLTSIDKSALDEYFQNRAKNFMGETTAEGWIKEEQQKRIEAIDSWTEGLGITIEKADVSYTIGEIIKHDSEETVLYISEWNTLAYKFNSENESREMIFETAHIVHISEDTHEIISDTYDEYTGYRYGSEAELQQVAIGENIGDEVLSISEFQWGMLPPEFNGRRVSSLTLSDAYTVYGRKMEITLYFKDSGLYCIEGVYALDDTSILSEIEGEGIYEEAATELSDDYTLSKLVSTGDMTADEYILCKDSTIEVYEYPNGTGKFKLTLDEDKEEFEETSEELTE